MFLLFQCCSDAGKMKCDIANFMLPPFSVVPSFLWPSPLSPLLSLLFLPSFLSSSLSFSLHFCQLLVRLCFLFFPPPSSSLLFLPSFRPPCLSLSIPVYSLSSLFIIHLYLSLTLFFPSVLLVCSFSFISSSFLFFFPYLSTRSFFSY